ncbi:hypothetical protein M8J75_013386 [Diaphorina citri]|nr:hypothetical protein M8J75_013386 [Diaphorina citri]
MLVGIVFSIPFLVLSVYTVLTVYIDENGFITLSSAFIKVQNNQLNSNNKAPKATPEDIASEANAVLTEKPDIFLKIPGFFNKEFGPRKLNLDIQGLKDSVKKLLGNKTTFVQNKPGSSITIVSVSTLGSITSNATINTTSTITTTQLQRNDNIPSNTTTGAPPNSTVFSNVSTTSIIPTTEKNNNTFPINATTEQPLNNTALNTVSTTNVPPNDKITTLSPNFPSQNTTESPKSTVVTPQPSVVTTKPTIVTTEPTIVTTEPTVVTPNSTIVTTNTPDITTSMKPVTNETEGNGFIRKISQLIAYLSELSSSQAKAFVSFLKSIRTKLIGRKIDDHHADVEFIDNRVKGFSRRQQVKEFVVVNSPEDKDDSSPKDKDDSSPKDKDDSSPENKDNSSPEDKDDGSPEDKDDSSPEDKDDSSPEDKDDSSPEDKDDSSPEDKDDSSPEDKDDNSPEDKDDSSPEDKDDSSPEDKDDSSPEDKDDSSPEDKDDGSPEDKDQHNKSPKDKAHSGGYGTKTKRSTKGIHPKRSPLDEYTTMGRFQGSNAKLQSVLKKSSIELIGNSSSRQDRTAEKLSQYAVPLAYENDDTSGYSMYSLFQLPTSYFSGMLGMFYSCPMPSNTITTFYSIKDCATCTSGSQDSELNISCASSYSPPEPQKVTCSLGVWVTGKNQKPVSKFPLCKKTRTYSKCPQLTILSQSDQDWVECTQNGYPVDCESKNISWYPGTELGIVCPLNYQVNFGVKENSKANISSDVTLCGESGKWSGNNVSCRPMCGMIGKMNQSEATPLVMNGGQAPPGYLPWVTALFLRDGSSLDYICSASIISARAVITAGHCVYTREPSELYLLPGNTKLKKNESLLIKVSEIKVPFSYSDKQGNYGSDIALLLTATPFEFNDFTRPICVDWANKLDLRSNNAKGKIAGWGLNENFKEVTDLKYVDLPVVSNEECSKHSPVGFKKFFGFTTFCAGYTNGTGVCNGDSGSGFMLEREGIWYIVGTVSISPRQLDSVYCEPKSYSLYTKTELFTPWMQSILQNSTAV